VSGPPVLVELKPARGSGITDDLRHRAGEELLGLLRPFIRDGESDEDFRKRVLERLRQRFPLSPGHLPADAPWPIGATADTVPQSKDPEVAPK
jgi:hypothetical protein